MPLTQLPPLDPSSQTFKADVDAFFRGKIQTFVNEVNALQANLNSIAAGGAYAIPYTFTPVPTAGAINTTNGQNQDATAVLTVYNVAANGADVFPQLLQLNGASSAIKSTVRLVKLGDPSKYLVFNVTGRVDSGDGYQVLQGAVVQSSSANPFTVGDTLMLFFQRTGDKGDAGPMPVYPYAEFTEQHASGVSANGGAIATGTYDRNLNTTVANGMGAVLSGGSFTLQAGTYDFEAIACAVANSSSHNKVVLQNTTDNTNIVGTGTVMTGSTSNIFSSVGGRFTITAPKTYKLRTWIGPVGTLPGQSLSSGYPEIYAQIKLWKLA